jgi:hypothetical protein
VKDASTSKKALKAWRNHFRREVKTWWDGKGERRWKDKKENMIKRDGVVA